MENKKQLYDLINGNPTPGTDCESTANEPRGAYLLQLKNWFETAYSESIEVLKLTVKLETENKAEEEAEADSKVLEQKL